VSNFVLTPETKLKLYARTRHNISDEKGFENAEATTVYYQRHRIKLRALLREALIGPHCGGHFNLWGVYIPKKPFV